MGDKKGCGSPATLVVFRGPTKRLYLCSECPYEGKGKTMPYETGEYDPKTAVKGRYTGPAKVCGEESS